MEENNSNLWLIISTALGSFILTAIVIFIPIVYLGLEKPTRTQVSAMITKEAPRAIDPIVKEIKIAQEAIKIQQAVTVSKLEHIVELLSKD